MTQDQRILNALMRGETLTPMTAWEKYGCYRLSAVIHRLRIGKGHSCPGEYNIKTKNINVHNRFGETINVAEYELLHEEQLAFA